MKNSDKNCNIRLKTLESTEKITESRYALLSKRKKLPIWDSIFLSNNIIIDQMRHKKNIKELVNKIIVKLKESGVEDGEYDFSVILKDTIHPTLTKWNYIIFSIIVDIEKCAIKYDTLKYRVDRCTGTNWSRQTLWKTLISLKGDEKNIYNTYFCFEWMLTKALDALENPEYYKESIVINDTHEMFLNITHLLLGFSKYKCNVGMFRDTYLKG